MESRRDIFQALADPTRRAIILLLAASTLTPNAIAANFDCSRQAISKHLQILQACELVQPETKGREISYQLNVDKMKELEAWLLQFKAIFQKRFSQLDTLLTTLKK